MWSSVQPEANMGNVVKWVTQNQQLLISDNCSKTKQNKTQNCVNILWDILYISPPILQYMWYIIYGTIYNAFIYLVQTVVTSVLFVLC